MINKIAICILALIIILPLAAPYSFAATEQSIASIFAEQSNKVVLIGAVVNKKVTHLGSGFIVRSDGLIATNYHVVSDAKTVFVKLKESATYLEARVVSFDAKKDIAFIKIDTAGLKPVVMGNSNSVTIGEKIVVIGNPLGLENTISDGLVSALRTTDNGQKLLQISAPLSSGSSGSPLFNTKGEVIGVTTSGRMDGQNLNFAVPINSVRSLMMISQYEKPKENLGFALYTVKPRDTLFGISKRSRTTVDKIIKLNNLNDSKIFAGQTLKIPSRHALRSEATKDLASRFFVGIHVVHPSSE